MSARTGSFLLLFLPLLIIALAGCGGGAAPNTISIFPPGGTVSQGAMVQFTATVTGNSGVNWTVQEGAAGGSITSSGVYTAPNKAGNFHIVATSQIDPSKSSIAVVTVLAVSISLNQSAVTLDIGNQFSFVANVMGTINTVVSWVVQEGASGGSITASGVYTAPGTHGTFHVIATSQGDATQTATATVTVTPLVVSVVPPSDVLGPLGVRTFTATVNTSLDTSVTWTVQEAAGGAITTAGGQYTAPNTTGLFHVVATSVQDKSKNGIANVTIAPSGFRPTGDMSTGRTAHTATLLPSGKVLIAGGSNCFGYNYGSCLLSSAEVYDSVSGKFTTTGNMSVTRVSHTATLLTNGKVLVTGGHDASAELYDPTPGTFAATAGSMSVGRNSHTATLLASGKVLIAGGQSVSGALATAELYDPNSGTFTATTGTMTEARMLHTATLLANGKVLIAGGQNASGALATAELYDPATGKFTATTLGMVSPRTSHAATLLLSNGNVLVTGGIANVPTGGSLSSAEVYNVGADNFTPTTGLMMTARDSHFAILLANGAVLVAGGSFGSNGAFTAELYDTVSGTFTQTGGMETDRALAAAVLLQDGRVLVSGGSDQISAELYK